MLYVGSLPPNKLFKRRVLKVSRPRAADVFCEYTYYGLHEYNLLVAIGPSALSSPVNSKWATIQEPARHSGIHLAVYKDLNRSLFVYHMMWKT